MYYATPYGMNSYGSTPSPDSGGATGGMGGGPQQSPIGAVPPPAVPPAAQNPNTLMDQAFAAMFQNQGGGSRNEGNALLEAITAAGNRRGESNLGSRMARR